LRPITEIVRNGQRVAATPASPAAPDPEQLLVQLETAFSHWIDDTVADYLTLFERDMRNRLQQDFRQLVGQWYEAHQLPLPDGFKRTDADQPPTPDD
jgi:hypothetical protein